MAKRKGMLIKAASVVKREGMFVTMAFVVKT